MVSRLMRGLLAMATLALVSGCETPETDAPSLLRNPTVPLSVIARGGAQAMEGVWHVRAASRGYADTGLVRFDTAATQTPQITLMSMSCDPAGNCLGTDSPWTATPIALNRWRLDAEAAGETLELWVIWIDDGLRTAALGSPDSDMAFILDRKAKGGADRLQAAREVLEFNGYNIAAFETR